MVTAMLTLHFAKWLNAVYRGGIKKTVTVGLNSVKAYERKQAVLFNV